MQCDSLEIWIGEDTENKIISLKIVCIVSCEILATPRPEPSVINIDIRSTGEWFPRHSLFNLQLCKVCSELTCS